LCVIQIDEVYLRIENNYRNGSFFGFADDGKPAKTLLYFLLKFEMGGPIIPYKYYPISVLNATKMFCYYKEVRNTILESGGQVIAVVTDNCRVNQRFLEMVEKEFHNEELPLNDTVHLLKCLRNNWYVKSNLKFVDPDDETIKLAKWSTLKAIYDEEFCALLKKSDLNLKSIAPKNVEKQSVPLALKVFSEKTQAAAYEKDRDSARFIEIVIRFFRICNNRSVNRDKHFLCTDLREIRDVSQLDWLVNFSGAISKSDISKDTKEGIARFVKNIRLLCERLLQQHSYEFVLLGRYQTDDIERFFCKLRQKVGGGYFLTHMQAAHTTRIILAKQALRMSDGSQEETQSVDFRAAAEGHNCLNCERDLTLEEEDAKEYSFVLVASDEINPMIREVIVYIGGYLLHSERISLPSDDCPPEWQKYVRLLDRGGLTIPSADLINFISMCYIFFTSLSPSNVCLNFLVKHFSDFLLHFPIMACEATSTFTKRLANIFCNNLSKLSKETTTTSSEKSLLKFKR